MSDVIKPSKIIAGAGGGCFRAGAQIQLQHGKTVPIETLKVGDEVLAFDERGGVHVAKVTKVHFHADAQPILKVKFWRGETHITPNHWVLNQYNAFVEMGSLTEHDALVDGMGHLRPITGVELIGHEPVWNLTVEPHHTFICDGVRVHNGGHRERYPVIAGAGGGDDKGGGGRAAVEDPDSLQSRAMVSLLDLLGEGEIGGLVSGAQSIFLGDAPLQNADGSYNFSGVSWEARNGTQGQTPISGFSDVETPFAVSTQVKVDTPKTVAITNPNADKVRAIVTIPSLISQDPATGDTHGATVQYKFQASADGGPFNDVIAWESLFPTTGAQTVEYGPTETRVNSNTGESYTYQPVVAIVGEIYDGDALGMGITVSAYSSSSRAVALQPQVHNGTAWVNHGDVIRTALDVNSRFPFFAPIIGMWLGPPPSTCYYSISGHKKIRLVVAEGRHVEALTLSNFKKTAATSTITITGKTRSRYQRHHLITLPKPATSWALRMVRLSADSASAALANDTYFDSYVETVDAKLSYPNSALVGVRIDSAQFNQIPSRSYLVRGLYLQIPSNFNQITKTYDGIWDGTFVPAVSSNPAWILYDLLLSNRYGLGRYIKPEQVDKAKLYQIGRYCDELIPDGFGGMEPRFAINTAIQSISEAYRLISDISAVFRGMTFWAGDITSFTQDSPSDSAMEFSQANVIDGIFNYVGSSKKDRHSVVLVAWNDASERYKQKIEYIEDAELVARYGIRKIETVAFGCTSRGQAARVGRWILHTERDESNVIQFKVGIDAALVMPGEIIKIHDQFKTGKRMAGRLTAVTATSATLDTPLTIAAAGATISIRVPDAAQTTVSPDTTLTVRAPGASFYDRAILEGAGTHSVVTWVAPLPELPVANAVWMVTEPSLAPIFARVIGMAQDGSSKTSFVISALQHNPNKYVEIETGLVLERARTSIINRTPEAPTDLSATDSIYRNGSGISTKIVLSWDMGVAMARGYTVRYRRDGDSWNELSEVRDVSVDIPNVVDGQTYEMRVYAVNALGKQSPTFATVSHTVVGKAWPPADVTGATATQQPDRVVLGWSAVADVDLADYEIRRGTTWESATYLGRTKSTTLKLLPMLAGNYTWLVKAVDTTGNYSTNAASAVLSVAVPGVSTVVASISGADYVLTWLAPSSSFDIAEYEIHHGDDINNTALITKTSSLSFKAPIDWLGARTFRVRAVDLSGNKGVWATTNLLTYSEQFDNATWTKYNVSISANAATAPDGTLTADKMVANATLAQHSVYRTGVGNADTYTVSIFLKEGEMGTAQLYIFDGTMRAQVTVNIADGTIATIAGIGTITNVGGGWYRVTATGTTTDSTEIGCYIGNAGSVAGFSGDGVSGIYIWGAQLELGSTPTTYAPTTSAPATSSSTSLAIGVPGAPSLQASIVMAKVQLEWTTPTSSIAVAEYELRHGATWFDGQAVGRITGNSLRVSVSWVGERKFWISAIDQNGNVGTAASAAITISVPAAPAVSGEFNLDQAVLTWTEPAASLPIEEYEIGYGATVIGRVKGTTLNYKANWSGDRTFWVKAYDLNHNVGAQGSVSLVVTPPSAPSITQQTVDNNVLLYWSGSTGTLPITTYELRKGASWATAQLIGQKSGGFTTVFETVSGTYTYWVAGVDSAGNYGTPASVASTVSQPPDYLLLADYTTAFPGIKNNAILDGGALLLPVDTAETWEAHFTGNAWTTPQAQITAGYPIFVQPGHLTGYYEETVDYVTPLAATKITVTPNAEIISGAPTVSCTISTSLDGTTWTNHVDVWEIFATNFRYAKVRVTVTGDAQTIYKLNALNIKLDVKLKNDAGTASAVSTDVGGTQVNFTNSFIDVTSITVTPQGTAPLIAIYDFVDVPNPTGFKVLLFNLSGVRQSGTVSWSTKGY